MLRSSNQRKLVVGLTILTFGGLAFAYHYTFSSYKTLDDSSDESGEVSDASSIELQTRRLVSSTGKRKRNRRKARFVQQVYRDFTDFVQNGSIVHEIRNLRASIVRGVSHTIEWSGSYHTALSEKIYQSLLKSMCDDPEQVNSVYQVFQSVFADGDDELSNTQRMCGLMILQYLVRKEVQDGEDMYADETMVDINQSDKKSNAPVTPAQASDASAPDDATATEDHSETIARLKEGMHYMRFASAAYGYLLLNDVFYAGKDKSHLTASIADEDAANEAALFEHTGINQADLLTAQWTSSTYDPGHYVALDHKTSNVLIVIRGTITVRDIVTDLSALSAEFKNGHVHSGMLNSANNKLKKLMPLIKEVLAAHPSFGIVCVGHSLGGGIAALMSILLQDEFPNESVRAFSFGCPCVMSIELAESTSDFITTWVNNKDIVCRLSIASVKDLGRRAGHAFQTTMRQITSEFARRVEEEQLEQKCLESKSQALEGDDGESGAMDLSAVLDEQADSDPDSDGAGELEYTYRKTMSFVEDSIARPLKSAMTNLKHSVRLATTFELQIAGLHSDVLLQETAEEVIEEAYLAMATENGIHEHTEMQSATQTSGHAHVDLSDELNLEHGEAKTLKLEEDVKSKPNHVRMFPPSSVFHMMRVRDNVYVLRLAAPRDFGRIPLGGTQFADHLPAQYERALAQCLEKVTPTPSATEVAPSAVEMSE